MRTYPNQDPFLQLNTDKPWHERRDCHPRVGSAVRARKRPSWRLFAAE